MLVRNEASSHSGQQESVHLDPSQDLGIQGVGEGPGGVIKKTWILSTKVYTFLWS